MTRFDDVYLHVLTQWDRDEMNNISQTTFKRIFFNENVWISIKISLKFVPKGPINNIPALVQIMAWRRPGDKPLSEPMIVSLSTHICVTRPQWVKWSRPGARFTNDFLPAIQIRWKLGLAVIPLLAIRSQQIFAHATTAQLSCQVQNFVTITVLESRWEWNEISIEFELRWKTRQWNGALVTHICVSELSHHSFR